MSKAHAMHQTLIRAGTTRSMLVVAVMAATACASLNRTEEGALIGAATGAAVGGIVGKYAGSTTKGAIMGAVVGGAAGALIGRRMDQRANELQQQLESARVERIGEGILVTFDSGLMFDFDSSQLRTASRSNLTDLASALRTMSDTDVLVAGHTDSAGAEDYNHGLSERRARAAADFLSAQGVSGARIVTVGLGEDEPIASNDMAEGRQRNRRVEVAIYASEDLRKEMESRYGEG